MSIVVHIHVMYDASFVYDIAYYNIHIVLSKIFVYIYVFFTIVVNYQKDIENVWLNLALDAFFTCWIIWAIYITLYKAHTTCM